ncbi:MAG TPA: putative glycoside hydrolase, partial [Thermomicrobiales bacterium]|nr:putative glycoside hydrolase [Thermomicrobiales bacterium]
MPRIPDDLTRTHPSRPLPWLPWAASILFLIGIIALVGTLIAAMGGDDDADARLQVLDAQTNGPIANAAVVIDGETYSTDENGWVYLPEGSGDVAIAVAHDGYVGREGTVAITSDQRWSVTLRPDLETQVALEATVETAAEQEQTLETGDASAPEIVVAPSAGSAQQTVAVATPSLPPAPHTELAGRITDAAGEPVQGALLTDGQNVEITGQDGLFTVKAQEFASETLRVSAPGFADTALSFKQAGQPIELQMELQPVKAIYYNPNISSTPEDVDRLIEITNTTEVNAIVVDVKEELIFYDSQVEFFRDVDVVTPVIDVPALLARFDEHNIYTIARHVVFKDSLVAERRPELAVRHVATGEVWRDMNGVAWVNPMLHDLW